MERIFYKKNTMNNKCSLLSIAALLLMLTFSCKMSQENNNSDTIDNTPTKETTSTSALPYTITVEKNYDTGHGMHSFAFANYQGYWVMIGGRKNGFHGTAGTGSKFPTSASNDSIFVFNTNKATPYPIYKSAIPEAYKHQLSSTNMAFCQNNNMLICVGGYGSKCASGDYSDACYETYPYLTTIDLGMLIEAVVSQAPITESAFQRISDDNFRVAGGELLYVNDSYYLVFGQNYNGVYKAGRTGNYTEQIRMFELDKIGTPAMVMTNYAVISDQSGQSGADSEFHRRDLNVVPALRPDKSMGIDVYGGVFNAEDNAYPNPILINENKAAVSSTQLKNGLYDCARVLIFDSKTNNMNTTLLGGIGSQYYNQEGQIVPDSMLPFNRIISTVQHAYPRITEITQPYEQRLPGFIGANAIFVANAAIPRMDGHEEIIDLAALKANSSAPLLIGKMYGGILASGTQTQESGGSMANPNIYDVYLNWN